MKANLGLVLLSLLAAVGCGDSRNDAIPTMVIEPTTFEMHIHGEGELKAAKATPVETPAELRGIQHISWLAEEGVHVEEGELLARLDDESILRRIREVKDVLYRLGYQLEAKQTALEKERRDLAGQLELLELERADAEQFAPRDEALYSRHEILDAKIDLDLIKSKVKHFEAQQERYRKRASAELEILRLQSQTEQVKLDQMNQALSNLEIRAPHPGFFLYGKTWQGEKMRVGMSIWPGMSLGELPDVSVMEAKIFVLESEAVGLTEDLPTEVVLDAHPSRTFSGKVKSIQPVANPIEQGSPVKYFEVLVSLDETDGSIMMPASEVRSEISAVREQEVLTVPNQAIFHEGDQTWVWIAEGEKFYKAPVELGQRSLSRTVVVHGLEPGKRVAMIDPSGAEAG